MGQKDEAELKVKLFGRFEVWRADLLIPSEAWPQRKTETLFKVLLTERGRVFTQDQLIEALFPELDVQKATQNLYKRISELRHILEPKLKKGTDSQYVLRAGVGGYCFSETAPCWLDTEEFRKHYQVGRELAKTDRWSQALEHYQQVTELYRGDFLAEDLYEEWSLAPRERWREHYLQALSQLIECFARLEQYQEAIESCQRLIALEPCRESAYRAKMLYHYYAGEEPKALQTYEDCIKAIKEELGVDPAQETRALRDLIQQGQVPQLPKVIPNNLPASLPALIGRDQEAQEVRQRLLDPHNKLITLTGPGGIGKTYLALHVASAELDLFPDGVFFVPLAATDTVDRFLYAIAEALRFSFFGSRTPNDQLMSYLREKKLLLILDNFDHLSEAAPLVGEIAQQTKNVKLLVTSRERIHLHDEWVFRLTGLEYPAEVPVKDLGQYGATALFLARATKIAPELHLDQEDPAPMIQICQLLDGNPLGIELAASWVHLLPLQEILQGIQRNYEFLSTTRQDIAERHRSMYAVFEYSWKLLSEIEKALLMKLAVFQGGFARDALEPVTGASVSQLSTLVDKSLVQRLYLGRCGLHEFLREYTLKKLSADAETEARVRDLHAAYYVHFLKGRQEALIGKEQKALLDEIEVEISNIRTAWDWLTSHVRIECLEDAIGGLHQFFARRGRFQEGIDLYETTIQILAEHLGTAEAKEKETQILGKLLARQGALYHRIGLNPRAEELLLKGLSIARHANEEREIVFCLNNLGLISYLLGDYRKGRQLHEESLAISRKLSHTGNIGGSLVNLGYAAYRLGEYEEARNLYRQGLEFLKEAGDQWAIAMCLNNLGGVTCDLGDFNSAKQLHQESLAIRRALQDQWGIAMSLDNLGDIALRSGEWEEAARLQEESLAIRREIGDSWGVAISLCALGKVHYHTGQLREALESHEQSLAIRREIREPLGIADSLRNIGLISLELDQLTKAKNTLREALQQAREIKITPMILEVLITFSLYFKAVQEVDRSLEILLHVFDHPSSDKWIREESQRLIMNLESELSAKDFKTMLKKGQSIDTEKLIQRILAE